MRSIYILISTFLFLLFTGCENTSPMDSEQYKKEVYLVGAYEYVRALDIMYTGDKPSETYITVTTSGSLNLDKDVKVELEIDEKIIDSYNELFFGILNLEKYYIPLEREKYNIPSLNNVLIEHRNGFSKNVPIFIETTGIDPDALYVIPIQIGSVSEYSVNRTGEKMLVKLNMVNLFSAQYSMEGTTVSGDKAPLLIHKVKNLKAVSKQSVRMFLGTENENKTNLSTKSIVLTIRETPLSETKDMFPVTITAWDNQTLEIADGIGTYDAKEEVFDITYSVISDGIKTMYNEQLSIVKK